MQPPLLPPPPNTADQAVQSRDHENNCILPAQALTQRTVRREGFCSVCVCMWGKEGGRWDGVSVVDFRRLVFKQTAAVVQGRREGKGAIKGLTEGSALFPHRSRRGQRWPSDSRHLPRSHWLTNMGKYDQEEFPDLFQDKVFLFVWLECTFISGNTSSQLLKYAPVFTEGYFF